MFKTHTLGFFGHLEHGFHVSKGGAENQLVALPHQIAHHTLGVRTFGHALDKAGLDAITELLLHRLAGVVMGKGPAGIAGRANINETDLQRIGFDGFGLFLVGLLGIIFGSATSKR